MTWLADGVSVFVALVVALFTFVMAIGFTRSVTDHLLKLGFTTLTEEISGIFAGALAVIAGVLIVRELGGVDVTQWFPHYTEAVVLLGGGVIAGGALVIVVALVSMVGFLLQRRHAQ